MLKPKGVDLSVAAPLGNQREPGSPSSVGSTPATSIWNRPNRLSHDTTCSLCILRSDRLPLKSVDRDFKAVGLGPYVRLLSSCRAAALLFEDVLPACREKAVTLLLLLLSCQSVFIITLSGCFKPGRGDLYMFVCWNQINKLITLTGLEINPLMFNLKLPYHHNTLSVIFCSAWA